MVRLWHVCGHDVCCALHSCLSSHVSPARLWPRPSNRTPPWRSWIWDYDIGPEGAKAWCLVRMVSWGERERHSHSKVKHAVQRWISGADAQKGTKKVSLRKRVSQLISWEKQRKRIQQHVLCINKQLACLRYLTLFSLNGELRPPLLFLVVFGAFHQVGGLFALKIHVFNKSGFPDFSSTMRALLDRPWRWLKKPWSETGPSSQGLGTGEKSKRSMNMCGSSELVDDISPQNRRALGTMSGAFGLRWAQI